MISLWDDLKCGSKSIKLLDVVNRDSKEFLQNQLLDHTLMSAFLAMMPGRDWMVGKSAGDTSVV